MPRIVTSLHASAAAISSRARQRTALHGPADVYEEEDDERAHKEVARTARRHDGGPEIGRASCRETVEDLVVGVEMEDDQRLGCVMKSTRYYVIKLHETDVC